MAADIRKTLKGAIVIMMCPGWVKTDMGGSGAQLSPEESVSGQLKVLQGLKEEDNGKYYQYSGAQWSW